MGDQITWRGYGGRVIQRARSTVVVEFGPIAQFKPIRGRFERNNPELLLVGRFTADRSLTGRPEAKPYWRTAPLITGGSTDLAIRAGGAATRHVAAECRAWGRPYRNAMTEAF
jgi:hypothetical protein